MTAFLVLLLLPEPAGLSPAAHRLGAATVLMVIFWVSQAIPIAATALIPLAAYPLLGIQSAENASEAYVNANIFLFFGGFIIALGIEKWGLHRRIALHVVHVIGGSPPRIVLGFMMATAFLSMWISNTATTMLMLPIAIALLNTLSEVELEAAGSNSDPRQTQAALSQLGIGLMLGIAYSASCGGLATLVGTPTNVTFLGQWKQLFPEAPEVSMGEWLPVFLPLTGLMLFSAYLVLTWRLPRQLGEHDPGRGFFRDRLRALGRASAGERAMLVVFVTTALLWVFRKPLQFGGGESREVWTLLPGWGPWYESFLIEQLGVEATVASGAVHDATVAMAMALLLFVLSVRTPTGQRERLIDWETVEHKMPWGIVLLLGGGFAMASAFHDTGLSAWLGETLASSLAGTPLPVIVICICLMMTFLTEFTSNVATVSTLLPILAGTAVTLGVDPRLLMIPATVTASCAFMLPIATPPNAIVFASGRVSMGQMIWHGLILNLLGVIFVTAVTFLLLVPIMDISLETLPDWAVPPRGTLSDRITKDELMAVLKSCGVLIVRGDPIDEFLLMKHVDRWDLPKGHVDPGESELECALRELEEETGILYTDINLVRDFRYWSRYVLPKLDARHPDQSKELIIFLARLQHETEIVVTEHLGYQWFPWRPPHAIQERTIDPVLAAVAEYVEHSKSTGDFPQGHPVTSEWRDGFSTRPPDT